MTAKAPGACNPRGHDDPPARAFSPTHILAHLYDTDTHHGRRA